MKKTLNEITILLVEDDEGHAELTVRNLERSGIANEVRHFESGAQLLDFLSHNKARGDEKYLVLLDLNMPGIDGHQVLKHLKSHDLTRNIPIIILTTAADEREVDRCYAMGCNLYINKPMDYEDFSRGMSELGLFLRKACVPGMRALVADHG